MGDQALMKDKHSKIIYLQKKRMITPDVMLHTRNVIVPIAKPVPFNKNFNVSLSENRPVILKVQNYKNKPALRSSRTPLYALHNPLEKLIQVKKICHRNKPKIQDTKYKYISGKTDFTSIKKTGSSQNEYPLNMLSYKRRHNSLCFPNTIFIQSKLLNINNRNLRQSKIKHIMHKVSSKSIELSRKHNLLQRKDNVKHEDKFAIISKDVIPISNTISKSQIISKLSQSLNNITNTFSPISTSSLSNYKIKNKEALASIENKYKSISSVASVHLHPSSCELEVNVLNYETDILLRNKISHSTLPHLTPPDIRLLSNEIDHLVRIRDNKEKFDNQNTIDKYKWNTNKDTRNVKYAWKTIDNWLPSYQMKRFDSLHEINKFGIDHKKPYDCKVKYSWQVIGISTQTSYQLLQDLLHDDVNMEANESAYKMCNIKYSWQIIGISTQASLHSYNDLDYWNGILLTPNKDYNKHNSYIKNNGIDYVKVQDDTKYPTRRLKRYLILNNQQTQTFSEKEIQTDINHCYKKYSWQNLIKQYL